MAKITVNRILCPTDFSESARHALQYALAFAEVYDGEIELLYVLELPFVHAESVSEVDAIPLPTERLEEKAAEQMDALVKECRAQYGRVVGRVCIGLPFLEIISAARRGKFDMVVMGTHGRTGLRQVLMGSVAERVVRKAPCPVLTVKPPGHQSVMP